MMALVQTALGLRATPNPVPFTPYANTLSGYLTTSGLGSIFSGHLIRVVREDPPTSIGNSQRSKTYVCELDS